MNNDKIKRPPKDEKRAEEVERCWKLDIGESFTIETFEPLKWKAYFYNQKGLQPKTPIKKFQLQVVQLENADALKGLGEYPVRVMTNDYPIYRITIKRISL